MKEIGESFKEARETIGISLEEACKDLNITEGQLENLEDGNVNAFKDVFSTELCNFATQNFIRWIKSALFSS